MIQTQHTITMVFIGSSNDLLLDDAKPLPNVDLSSNVFYGICPSSITQTVFMKLIRHLFSEIVPLKLLPYPPGVIELNQRYVFTMKYARGDVFFLFFVFCCCLVDRSMWFLYPRSTGLVAAQPLVFWRVNTLMSRQSGRHFPDDISRWIF